MKKDKRRTRWILIFLLIIAVAILAGYYFRRDKTPEKTATPVPKKKAPLKITEVPLEDEVPKVKEEIHLGGDINKKEEGESEKIIKPVQEDPCKVIEDQVQDFFKYLNGRSYIQDLEEGMDTYNRFKVVIEKLSSQPPIPAGEGLDMEYMIRNIFFFCRVLGRKDIRLIKAILRNEADTLEMNLEVFYEWLMLGDRCPDKEGIRPSSDLTYLYAGFLLNTIGGRSYLLRRSIRTRLLISYYCVLILYEADKKGKNRYGIDVYSKIDNLIEEIGLFTDLRYQDSYIDQLRKIQEYYLERR